MLSNSSDSGSVMAHGTRGLSYELFSSLTSLSWGDVRMDTFTQSRLYSRGLQLVGRKWSLILLPEEHTLQQAKQQPKQMTWMPKWVGWVCLSLHLGPKQSPILSFTWGMGFGWTVISGDIFLSKVPVRSWNFPHTKKSHSVKKFLPNFVQNHLKNIGESHS